MENERNEKTVMCLCATLFWESMVRHKLTLISHLWHRKAFWRILASLSILCIDSSSQQPISSQCTPLQRPRWSQFPVGETETRLHGCIWSKRFTVDKMGPTRMYKALSELFLNSLMVANTERMRQEKTKRKLEETENIQKLLLICLFMVCQICQIQF